MYRQDCGQGTRVGDHCSGQVPQDPELCYSSAVQESSAWIAGTPPPHPETGQAPQVGQWQRTQQRGPHTPRLVCFTSQAASISPPHSPKQGPTLATLVPGLGRGTCLRNSSYLHVLLPRDPVPSGRPGPQLESQPAPVYKKEGECLLLSASLKPRQPHCHEIQEPPGLPGCLSLQSTQMEGQSSTLCLSTHKGQPSPRGDPRGAGTEPPSAHHPPLWRLSTRVLPGSISSWGAQR